MIILRSLIFFFVAIIRSFLEEDLLEVAYFCGGILSHVMLSWFDNAFLQSGVQEDNCSLIGRHRKLQTAKIGYSVITACMLHFEFRNY